ncbi:MAG: LacI family transcriptional regulator [Chloroflexi bacterium]|nr:LacI family transcriptional regulator [Chloroflexota bacterium]
MATIKDVAKRAGVSVTTVSHVLNETRYVSPELVARVWEAVEALNYQPNAVARSLRRKRTHTLGMIIPDNSNPFFAEVARGIEDVCFDLGYNVILCNSDQDPQKERRYIDLLTEKRVDGIVFVAAGDRAEHLEAVLTRRVPVVVIDRELQDVQCDRVLTDNRTGGRQATEHLIQRGRTRIACIAGPSDVTPSWERVWGYQDALTEAGLPFDEQLIRRGNFQAASGYRAMRELLALSDPPTGVFACNDMMAIGAICAISEAGLRIPEDIAVVGFDDIALASYTNPPLTTVAQPRQEIGRLAAEMLIERISNRSRPPQRHLLETWLVVRQST